MKVNIKGTDYFIAKEEVDGIECYYVFSTKKEPAGFLMYAKTYQTYSRQIFLSNIEVVPEFRYAGIGQFLLNILEQDALISRFDSIEGKYFPSNEYARTFYDKNGYEIYKDGYETYVCKQIDLDAERDEKTVDLIHKLNESISEDTSFRLSNRNFSSYSDREF